MRRFVGSGLDYEDRCGESVICVGWHLDLTGKAKRAWTISGVKDCYPW